MLIKRGIDRTYVLHFDDLQTVKGKVAVSETLKTNLLFRQRILCAYDDLSSDIQINKILVSTLHRLLKTRTLDNKLKNEMVKLRRMLADIQPVVLRASMFNGIRYNRNNRFYEFIINVCKIVFDSTFPSERLGEYQFSDFTRDEHKMNQLFESFIRNFYKIEQQRFRIVRKEIIKWQFDEANDTSIEFLPRMETDITLENKETKVIIDAKYYRETMTVNFDKERIRSANLYQLFSYLINQRDGTPKTQNASGVLLYPTVEKDYDVDFMYQGHNIQIRTVNLNTNWRNISRRLKQIVGVSEMNSYI